MPLDSTAHRQIDRATKDRRNAAARDRLAQVRGRELAKLRREVANLRVILADRERRLQDALFTLQHCACGATPQPN